MPGLLDHLRRHAAGTPSRPALSDGRIVLDYAALLGEVERLAELFPTRRVGLLLRNGAHWACLDLALLASGAVCVPMPGFFSDAQLRHLIDDAGLDLVATDQPERLAALLPESTGTVVEAAGRPVTLFARGHSPRRAAKLPAATVKVTYTSGTTGHPKGVCLSAEAIETTTRVLCEAVRAGPDDRSLSLLPLSTLLENIAGLYAPLRAGALAQLPDLALCGMAGSSGLQAGKLFAALSAFAPTTLVLVPQLLKALGECVAAGMPLPSSLRFVAVGGAPVPTALLERARSLGLPVYQGYGLSEAGSVVSLNLPGAERAGSVGKILPQHRVSIAADGEILVGGNLFSGYLGSDPGAGDAYRTGDLGWLDAHGYLYLRGRKKTAYATAFGRKVAPEWVEGELAGDPRIVQAAVFGEGRPFNVAVLVPRQNPQADLEIAMESVNARLPDYARIRHWIVADAPFTPGNGLANCAGCIRREAIRRHYRHHLEVLFAKEETHAFL